MRPAYVHQLPKTDPRPFIVIKSKVGTKLPYYAVRILPINLFHIPALPDVYDPQFEYNGLMKRTFCQTPPFKGDLKLISELVNNVCNAIPPLPYDDESRLFEQWVNSVRKYSLATKNHLRSLFQTKYHLPLSKKDYCMKGFTKDEFYDDIKHSRMIFNPSDMFKVKTGGVIHAMEKHVMMNPLIRKHFAKGMTTEQMGERVRQIESFSTSYFATDYSSYEASIRKDLTQLIEKPLFEHFLSNYPATLEAIKPTVNYTQTPYERRKTRFSKIPAKLEEYDQAELQDELEAPWVTLRHHRIKHVEGRKSGQMWTSLMNGLINYVAIQYVAAKNKCKVDFLVEGDDSIGSCSNITLDPKYFTELGLIVKIQQSSDITTLGFCSHYYEPTTNACLMHPHKLPRFGFTPHKNHMALKINKRRALAKAKAMSFITSFPQCPIITELCRSVILNISGRPKFTAQWWGDEESFWKGMPNLSIPNVVRIKYEELFGIPIQEQLRLEQQFREHPLTDYQINIPGYPYIESFTELLRQ